MKLSQHFSLTEFTHSQTAIRRGIENEPSKTVINNLKKLCETLEQVRELLDAPMFISSGYRSTALNKAVGGSSTSAHVLGYAADFTCPAFGTPNEIVKVIKKSSIKYDQLIAEGGKDGWVHISASPNLRQQTLTATFINGKPVYMAFA